MSRTCCVDETVQPSNVVLAALRTTYIPRGGDLSAEAGAAQLVQVIQALGEGGDMRTGCEWIRSTRESWHVRRLPPPSRRVRSTTALCGVWFPSGEPLAVWAAESEPSRGGRCGVCATARRLLESFDDGSQFDPGEAVALLPSEQGA